MVAGRVGTAERSGVPLMADYGFPWVTWTAYLQARVMLGRMEATAAGVSILSIGRTQTGFFTERKVPAGTKEIQLTFPRPNASTALTVQLYSPSLNTIYTPTDYDGGSPSGLVASGALAPVGATTWTPKWTTPVASDIRLLVTDDDATNLSELMLPGLRTGGSPTGLSGVPARWDYTSVGTTTSPPRWAISGAASGPWITSEVAGRTLIVAQTWAGPRQLTIPFYVTGGSLTVSLAAVVGAPTLTSLGGATDLGGGVLSIPAGTWCSPVWDGVTDGATMTMTKDAAGAYQASYGPYFSLAPVVPPPAPTITKIIPTSGPDTGGTLVDIVGTDLTGATAVDFGGTAGTGLTVDPSGGLATVTSPAHTAGPAPVTITTPAGVSNAETFTFEAPPVVTVPVIYEAYPVSLCADAPDNQQVLIPVIFPVTDVVSAEVGGVDVGVVGVLDVGGMRGVVMGAPVLPPGTYDLVLTNSAGSSDPYPIEYLDCEGCPPDPTVVAVFPGAALPGATIQIVGTNLTGATVTMCGETVAIVSNDGTILTVVVPPGCPDGPATITVTTPDGETTVEFTVLPPEPVPPADVSPRSWQIAQALLDAAFLCGAECARAFVTTDATPEGPPPGGCPCQLTATIVKDGYKTADGRRLVRSATIKLSLHQCTPIPQADEIPDPDTESDYALRQAETRDQMLRGLATARRQPSSVLGRCQTKQASEGWVHVSTTGGMSLYTMEVTVD